MATNLQVRVKSLQCTHLAVSELCELWELLVKPFTIAKEVALVPFVKAIPIGRWIVVIFGWANWKSIWQEFEKVGLGRIVHTLCLLWDWRVPLSPKRLFDPFSLINRGRNMIPMEQRVSLPI